MVKLGNVFLLGDSYSTFLGHIPEGFACWYNLSPERDTDVDAVEQTWWHQLFSATDSNLIYNCSWSGSTVCHRGYNGNDVCHNSFVTRFDNMDKEGYFAQNPIDTFIIFGGTNDNWAQSPVGELMIEGWTKEKLYSALPAFCYLLHRVKGTLPNTRILWIINTELRPEIENGIMDACAYYGVETIVLKDIAKQSGHPNQAGMEQIFQQVLAYLEE